MQVEGFGIEGIAQTDRPGPLLRDLPRILRVEVEICKIERLIRVSRKSLSRRRCHPEDELRQVGVSDQGNCALAEIKVIQTEESNVRAEPDLVWAMTPSKVVVDEKP